MGRLAKVFLLLILFVGAFVVASLVINTAKLRPASTGDRGGSHSDGLVELPDLELLSGGTVDFKKLDRTHAMCVLFSITCPGCARDAEFWGELKSEAEKLNVAFYLISIDADRDRVQRFAKQYEFDSLPVLVDEHGRVSDAFKATLVPQYILLRSDGKILGRWDGITAENTPIGRAERIAELLQEVRAAKATIDSEEGSAEHEQTR